MSSFSTRMIARVLIEFDTGSEYGGGWTFEAAYKDAVAAAEGRMRKISSSNAGIRVIKIESIQSHCMEQKS